MTSCAVAETAELEYNYAEEEEDIVEGKVNYRVSMNEDVGVIIVYNGYLYSNGNTMEEILNYIINSDEGKVCNLSVDDIPYYKAEWMSLSVAHKHPEIAAHFIDIDEETIKTRTQHVDLNTNDTNYEQYVKYYKMLKMIDINA
jgi:hypothetical protein